MEGYKVVRRLGEGGFGQVVLAQNRITKQMVAIKTVKKRAVDYEEKMKFLREEAALLSTIDHMHIVRILDKDIVTPFSCLVMEYCAGGDLRGAIEEAKQHKTSITLNIILRVFCQSILALQHCHHPLDGRTIIVHRDIKPENILMMANGMIKLADFGLGKTLRLSQAVAQSFVGTRGYLAPEILSGQPYDLKADMYSLGCVIFELITLRLPDIRKRGIERAFDILMPPGGSLSLQQTVTSLLAQRPTQRPSTGDVLASSDFARWLSEDMQNVSTHENLDRRARILDEREAEIQRRATELKDREKRLLAREATLEAKANRIALRKSASPA